MERSRRCAARPFQSGAARVVAIVGANGAGKTSLLSAIAGIVTPAEGSVAFAGRPLLGLQLESVVQQGIALVPEGRHIFASMTVLENLMLGATIRRDAGSVKADIDEFFETFPILGHAAGSRPGNFPAASSNSLQSPARCSRAQNS